MRCGCSPCFIFNREIISVLASLIFGLILVSNVCSAEPDLPLLISSGAEYDYPPFCFVNDDGQADGFSIELFCAALQSMGCDTTFRTGPWAEVRTWLENGEVQALPLVGRTPEREPLFDFTFPYLSLHGAIVVRKGITGIQNLNDLSGKQVVVMKGDNAEEFLRREKRDFEIHTTATFQDALRKLSEGKYDAVVIQRLVALRLIQETGLTNLQVIAKLIEGFRQDFSFAVQEGDRDTLALLNEGLALVMADGTYRHLHAKWFASMELPSSHRIIVGGDHNYPPYEYLDKNGRPAGYNVELTRAIADEVGLDIEIQLGPWFKIQKDLEQGEIDIIQGMLYSPERDLKFDFTQPHLVNHCVSVVRKDSGAPPSSIDELRGKHIVVQRGDLMHDFAAEHGLGGQITVLDAQEDALRELAEGKYDCALAARLTALYWIDKNGWENLTVGQRPLASSEYCYAVADNQKALLARFSEGLKVLENNGEYRRIYQKWMGVYEDSSHTYADILRYIAFITGPLLLTLLAIFLWSWSLRKQVARQTKELRESEKQLRLLADNTIDIIWLMDMDTRFTYVNPSIISMFGYSPEEFIGTCLADHCSKESMEKMQQIIDYELEHLEEHHGVIFETQMLKRDGTPFPVEIHGTFLFDEMHRPISLQGTTRDITKRKRAEEALRAQDLLLREMGHIAKIGAWELDPATGKVTWTEEVARIHGLDSNSETNVETALNFYTSDSRKKVEDAILKAIEDGTAYVLELELTSAKGETKWVRTIGQASIENRKVVRVRGSIQDITEQKKAERERERMAQQLRQAQQMESIGRLAGGVAHDFNNMLMVIQGFTDLALRKIGPDDPIRKDLKEVMSASERSTDLTRQLLAFARKQTIAPKALDLNERIGNALKFLGRLIGEDIDLLWKPVKKIWPVKMDPAQLDQILANLAVNARDAINGVGKVTIETGCVTFDEEYCADHTGFIPGEFVLLAVSDDGAGMDKETLANIFEPFFTTKSQGKGTGLGLATIYGIVKQNFGFINVYSEPQKGTTFRLYFPRLAVEETTPSDASKPEEMKGGTETILLVEDETPLLNVATRFAERLGYTVLPVDSPGKALATAMKDSTPIHLLMTDVVMPGMNGRDLWNQLVELRPGIKCLFMSGYTANVIAHRGILEEDVHFIGKPFSIEALAAKLRETLED